MPTAPSPEPQHRTLTPSQLHTLQQHGDELVVLDLRGVSAEEFHASHLPGAHRLAPTAEALRVATLTPGLLTELLDGLTVRPTVRVLAHGRTAGRAAGHLCWLLERAGHPRTALLDGGYDAWWRLNLPLDRDEVAASGPQADGLGEDGMGAGGLAAGDLAAGDLGAGDLGGDPGPMTVEDDAHLATLRDRGQVVDVSSRTQFRRRSAAQPAEGAPTNLPAVTLADQAGRLRSVDEVLHLLRRAHVDPYQPFAVCGADLTTAAWAAYVTRRAGAHALLHVTG